LLYARTALDQLERLVGLERQRVSLVLNRHDPRYHHSPQEVQWHLGAAVAAVIPFDYAAMQRATAEQRPLVLDPASRAARALLVLAERLNEGKLHLAAEPRSVRTRGVWWRRLFRRTRPAAASRPLLDPAPARFGALRELRSRTW